MLSSRIADLLIRHPITTTALLLAATAAALVMAVQLPFDFSPQSVLSGDAELVRELENFKQDFAYQDSVLLIVLEATGDGDVLDRETLTWQARTTRAVDALPQIERVESLATLELPGRTLDFPPEITTWPAIRNVPVDEATESRLRRLTDRSRLLQGTLLSENRKVAALHAFIYPQISELDELRSAVDAVQSTLEEHPPPDGYRVHVSGLPYLRVNTVDNLQADQVRLLPIAGLLYLVTLWLTFRRPAGSLVPLAAVGMGLVWTIGVMAAAGQSFNLISNVLPVLLLVIGISNCVHVVDDYADQSAVAGNDRTEAVRRTIHHMGRACLLTLATTAIGFTCLLAARSSALQAFGWQAAMGMGFLYLSIIGTLGSLLRFFRAPRRSAAGAPLSGIVTAAGDIVDDHPKTTLIAAGALIAVSLWAARDVRVNSYMIETYEESHPTLQTLRLVEDKLSGLLPLEVSLRADDPDRFLDAGTFRRVLRFEEFARKQEPVLFARSYADFHREVLTGGLADAEPQNLAGDSEENLESRLDRSAGLIRRIGGSLNYSMFMTGDGTRARVLLKVRDAGTYHIRGLIGRLDAKLSELFPPGSGIQTSLTGDAYVNTVAMNLVIRDLFYSLLAASLIVFAVIALIFRSLRVGLIAAIPNLTPLALTLGYMGLQGYDMNAGNVIVFTISLGIAVDDSIHFLFRFREEMKARHDVWAAAHYTFQGTGRAIVITSLLIVSGLAVLLLSDFVPTRRFAELTSVSMVGALIGDLLLLPSCLVLFWKQKDFP